MDDLVQLTKPICNGMNPGGRTHVQKDAFLHRVLMSLNANGIYFNVKTAKTEEQTRYRLACVGFFSWIFITLKNEIILILGLDPLVPWSYLSLLLDISNCPWNSLVHLQKKHMYPSFHYIHVLTIALSNQYHPSLQSLFFIITFISSPFWARAHLPTHKFPSPSLLLCLSQCSSKMSNSSLKTVKIL